ncbi:MAG: transcription elongation factor GreB [Casimicrobiaceae bacterium]
MNKAFTRESEDGDDAEDDAPEGASTLPAGTRNYMTPGGFARLKAELDQLVGAERPALVATVSWAASNGDRSENGDYIYGKKRLREVDRRIRFLKKRLDLSQVVDPASRDSDDADRIFFGATITVVNGRGEQRTVSIVGVDEIDTTRGYISWVSPMARALLKASEGDTVTLQTPGGTEELTILEVAYRPLDTAMTDAERPR